MATTTGNQFPTVDAKSLDPDLTQTPPSGNESAQHIRTLTAAATKAYSDKDYALAADLYAQVSELQAQINGETSIENAEILFLYGRSLFNLGVSKSDVLGGKADEDKPKPDATASTRKSGSDERVPVDKPAPTENSPTVVSGKEATVSSGAPSEVGLIEQKKALFQFTGDENWDDDDDDDDVEEAEEGHKLNGQNGVAAAEEEDEEDDLTAAWNVLDLARVLLTRKLEAFASAPHDDATDPKGKGPATESTYIRHVKERLAESHDILAEISLEGEKFPQAVVDFRAALALKKALYPEDSSLRAEAHYKLSLALEFASSITSADATVPALAEGGAELTTEEKEAAAAAVTKNGAHIDEEERGEAVKEMEAAISSCRLRIAKEEKELREGEEIAEADKRKMRAGIEDVMDMVADMEQRVIDLRAPPMTFDPSTSTLQPHGQAAGAADSTEGNTAILSGILGSMLGESPEDQRRRVEEATLNARDLTGLVRRRKPAGADPPQMHQNGDTAATKMSSGGNAKRKADSAVDEEKETNGQLGSKKARVEDESSLAADENKSSWFPY